jgi:hypothetical protein
MNSGKLCLGCHNPGKHRRHEAPTKALSQKRVPVDPPLGLSSNQWVLFCSVGRAYVGKLRSETAPRVEFGVEVLTVLLYEGHFRNKVAGKTYPPPYFTARVPYIRKVERPPYP